MLTRVLSRLDAFFALPPASGLDPEIARSFRHNFLYNTAEMVSWLFGISFISVNAILPVFASHLTDSALVIGLVPALTDALWFLPQLFLAPYVERLPRKLPAVLVLGLVERLPYLFLPLGALWLDGLPRTAAMLVFLLLITWKALGSGIVATPWQELMAKVIPVSHRGRFFGSAHFVGQTLGIGGSALAALILARLPYPQNFAACFAVGFIGIAASWFLTLQTREPAQPPPAVERPSLPQYLDRLKVILRRDGNFRAYLASRWFSYFGGMAYGFIAVYAVQRFGLGDSAAAVFTGILYAGGVAGYAFWGPLGDRVGHKRVMEAAASLWLLALGVIWLAPAVWAVYLVFGLMGFQSAGGVLSDLNIAMEFGPEAERPTYIGLARTSTGPALLIAPVLGGWIAQTWSYPALFVVSLACAAAGLAVLSLMVRDPRHNGK